MSTIAANATDVSITVLFEDASGDPVTGLAATDLTAWYWRTGAASATEITASDLTDPDDAHSNGGFLEIDATNMPGQYRFDVPDAMFASGADQASLTLQATGAKHFQRVWDIEISPVIATGTVGASAAADATTVNLSESLPDGAIVFCYAGTGAGQTFTVEDGSTASSTDIYQGLHAGIDTDTLWIAWAGAVGESVANVSGATAAAIADAVLTEAVADHSGTAGSLAEAIADILTDTETTIPALIAALNDPTAAAVAAAILAATVEGSVTVQQSLALANAAAAGKVSGAATTSVALRNLADSLDRISATTDEDGNRSAVTTTFTDL